MTYNKAQNSFSLSVRDIVDFVYRDGHVGGDGYSLPEERMLAGAKFHRSYEARMEKKGFIPEYRMEYTHKYSDGLTVEILGIADLVKIGKDTLEVGEIKTVSKDVYSLGFHSIPKYAAQCLFYLHMLICEKDREDVRASIIYHNIDSRATNAVEEIFTPEEAREFFEETMDKLHVWLLLWLDHVNARDESIKTLGFPYGSYRKGQRELCAGVYRSVRDGVCKLFAEAPTGTGKTVSALFPAVKAMGEGNGSKIFYLTAKVITRGVAKEAAEDLRRAGFDGRVIVLSAKAKSCLGGGNCMPSRCKYSKDHGERVNDALYALITEQNVITPETVAEYAERFTVCPHELALDATYFCDIVVGDYNHAYDPSAMLQRYFSGGGDYILLVDEAHNLPDRARDMYSCMLEAKTLRKAAKELKNVPKKLSAKFSRLAKEIVAIGKNEPDVDEEESERRDKWSVKRSEAFDTALEALLDGYRKLLASDEYDEEKEKTLDVFFDCKFFSKLTELDAAYSGAFACYFDKSGRGSRLNIACTDPSEILSDLAKKARTTVLFSATLSPFGYYFNVLGGDMERDKYVSAGSPFPKENLEVIGVKGISTRFKDRDRSYGRIAALIFEKIKERVGNYLVFFPSFKYLERVYELFDELAKDMVETVVQKSEMTDAEREEYLLRFEEYGVGTLVGFAVCGGVFSEGIDLKGDRLSGVIVVGTGMPAVCFERDLLRKAYDAKGVDGFDYAYTYPGLNRVFQAGGRVIRTETDKGFIMLIDDRYPRAKYFECIPEHWKPISWKGYGGR